METLKPKLRFPEFDGNWERKILKKTCVINPSNKKLPQKFIYIDLESVNNGLLHKENEILLDYAPSRAQRLLNKEDVLFQMVRPYQKNNFYFDKVGDYVASTGYAQLRANESSKFLFQYIHNQSFVDRVIEKCTGSNYPAINSTDLANIFVVFPENNEQTKIANFLASVDEKINLLKEKKSLLEDYKKGNMQKIFNQEIRFKDDNGNDFEDWKITTLGEIAEIKRGAASQHLNYVNDSIEGIRLLRINDFLSDDAVYVKNTKEIQRFKVETGDLLIAGTGATAGIVFTVPKKFNNLPFSYNAPRIKIINDFNKFIYYYLKSDLVLIQQKRLFVGNAQPFLDTDAMRGFIINLPSMNEQIKIANFLSAIDEKIELVSNQIQDAQEYKKGLLQKMFV